MPRNNEAKGNSLNLSIDFKHRKNPTTKSANEGEASVPTLLKKTAHGEIVKIKLAIRPTKILVF